MRARDNPFAVERFDRVKFRFPSGESMETLLVRLRDLDMRGSLVGPEGRGKSTLLAEMERRLAEEGIAVRRFRLRAGDSRPPAELAEWLAVAGEGDGLLLDGAEQLSLASWFLLRFRSRRLAAFVITSHRKGLLPTLMRCETSPALLRELIDELAPDRPASFPSPESLWQRHQGDIRQAMFEAYDRWE